MLSNFKNAGCKIFTKNLSQGGIERLLNSPGIVEAFKRKGNLSLQQLKDNFKWGNGPVIKFQNNPGYKDGEYAYIKSAKGNTSGDGNEIRLNIKLVKMLENAKPEDREAALLVIVITLLHEENHRGRSLSKTEYIPPSKDDTRLT